MSENQRPQGLFSMLRRIITLQNISTVAGLCGLAGIYATYVRTDALKAADYAQAARHTAEFEISVDQRLNEQKAWARQTDMDREIVRNALQAKIDELVARFNQRTESRNEQFSRMNERMSAMELKLCVLANRKVSECK